MKTLVFLEVMHVQKVLLLNKVSIFVIQKLQVSQRVADQRQHKADIKKDMDTARRILRTNEVGCYLI